MDPISKFLNENFVFSEKTLWIDPDKMKSSNVLIIVGHMGSGKSTLGKQLAEKYNGRCYGTDEWVHAWWKQYVEPIENDPNFTKEKNEELFVRCWKEFKKMLLKESKKGLVIAEGIHLSPPKWKEDEWFGEDWTCPFSVIVIRKSILRSMWGVLKRGKRDNSIWSLYGYLYWYAKESGNLEQIFKDWTKRRIECSTEVKELE